MDKVNENTDQREVPEVSVKDSIQYSIDTIKYCRNLVHMLQENIDGLLYVMIGAKKSFELPVDSEQVSEGSNEK